MEEQKIDKRSKEYKESIKATLSDIKPKTPNTEAIIGAAWESKLDPIAAILVTALPVSKAEFHAAVNNVDNVPETHFSEKSDNKGRRAEMWLTAGGNLLICKQENVKRETKYIGVPAASVKFVHFK